MPPIVEFICSHLYAIVTEVQAKKGEEAGRDTFLQKEERESINLSQERLGLVSTSTAAAMAAVARAPLLLVPSFFFLIAPATTLHSCPTIATTVTEEKEQ